MKLLILFKFALAMTVSLCCCQNQNKQGIVSIIPIPVKIIDEKGFFDVNSKTKIVFKDSDIEGLASHAAALWKENLGFELLTEKVEAYPESNFISLSYGSIPDYDTDEAYRLSLKNHKIDLLGKDYAGVYYAIQTLNQLLRTSSGKRVPCLTIYDFPRFLYRGLHLDVSRHFMPVEFIFRLLDYMAIHKLNVFHWHLVDDQGWRLEIQKYPKLTEVGAWRVDMSHKHWNERPLAAAKSGDATYGGYYTQKQVREIVAYAAERNITVMPEIEMPAHVMSALAAYPEYSCTGKNLGVPPGGVWPITHIYCAGNDATFSFLQDIFFEVMELFPSRFIHVGGDEADKSEWMKCPKCQRRMKEEGLQDEQELQSYFINRIERFLNEHGRILVGWDEIIEGGLAPNAVVMSWRGEQGGIEAALTGNHAIMTPGSHLYFDHYQGDPALEPLAIGGYTTLKKVYEYEPIPEQLTREQSKKIMGAQANVWTEYMPTPSHVEYMVFPRLAALAEVLWSPKESRNWDNFLQRMEHQYKRYEQLGINYSRSANQVKIAPVLDPKEKTLTITLETNLHKPEIRFTLDGSKPNAESPIYKNTISIKKPTTIKAAVFKNGLIQGQVRSALFVIHKAFVRNVELKFPNSPRYDGQGEYTLVDGVIGSTSFSDGKWKGFLEDDLIATIDLGKPVGVEYISVDALQNFSSWIFYPTSVSFEVSNDGVEYTLLETVRNETSPNKRGQLTTVFETRKTHGGVRFVRVTARNIATCPEGHSGAGQKAWLFVSEIIVK